MRRLSNFLSFIDLETIYGANNYFKLPITIVRGQNVHVYDDKNKKYIDCVGGYSTVSQGHCHPKIVKALIEQSNTLTLCSRTFYNDKFSNYTKFACQFFNFPEGKLMPTSGGAEAVDTAIKLARRYGYEVKGVEKNKACVVVANKNFHGRSVMAVSLSSDPTSYGNYEPLVEGITKIEYNNLEELEKTLQNNKNIVAFMIEPIQGEAGIIVPNIGYLKKAYDLCHKYNVLFIADEIQTGCGRTGLILACDYEQVKPDILIIGKGLSGGMFPISAVIANKNIMNVISAGTHGSTFGGSPLASAVAMEALKVIKEEKLDENSKKMGIVFRSFSHPLIKEIRGKGLLNAIELYDKNADTVCNKLIDKGILVKPTGNNIIRIAPALTINKEEIFEIQDAITKVLDN